MKMLERKLRFGVIPPIIKKDLISQRLRLEQVPTGKTPYDLEEPKADQELNELETNND